jgi:hypothetical protein
MVKSSAMKYFRYTRWVIELVLIVILGGLMLTGSVVARTDQTNQVRVFTRPYEFDYFGWTVDALKVKLLESSLGTSNYLSSDMRQQLVLDYLELVGEIRRTENELLLAYTDPNIQDPSTVVPGLRAELDQLNARRELLAPVAEATLQSQISYVIDMLDLDLGGQPFPPVLYHSTPLPYALIVSPRDVIRQDENISLIPDISVEEQIMLEEKVDQELDVSSLVVGIGGVGVYPSMVQQTTNLNWLSEVIAHEWVHNFLTLRPLGANYLTSEQLRTMNETTASIAGKEIGLAVLETFYPQLVPPPPAAPSSSSTVEPDEPPAFDYRKEMHITRVNADKLLSEGKIEEAEEYMEMRRKIFWDNGYRNLRKINQAYFAFYGAYADEPGGAAPEKDPVGEAVRTLRENSDSLAEFLNRISWIYSFEQLEKVISEMG